MDPNTLDAGFIHLHASEVQRTNGAGQWFAGFARELTPRQR